MYVVLKEIVRHSVQKKRKETALVHHVLHGIGSS